MSFAAPLWLLVGALVVAALALFHRAADRRRARDLARFASPRLLADLAASLSPARRRARRALRLGAIALLFVALAEPRLGFEWEETSRRGIDVLIALDVSRSMLARDVAPDRLTRAKLAITDLADRLPGDRLGLIAFAGTAFLQCPLTVDHAAFQQALDVLEPGVIPAPGSDLASALEVAAAALQSEKRNVKLIVLVSDGEDLGGGAIAAAERVAADGVRVYTIGVGEPSGELIPVPGAGGATEFVKDDQGRYVKSRLDEATLRSVADATGGFYEPLGARGQGIEAVVERAIAPIPKEELAARMRRVPVGRAPWAIAAALLFLAIEMLLAERRRAGAWRRPWSRQRNGGAEPATPVIGAVLAAALLGASLLGAARTSHASAQQAEELFAAGEYERALEEYRDAAASDRDDPRLDFNVGAAAYKAGRFDEAAAAFARALRSESPELQEQSFYNLGNAQFRLGERQLEADPQQTMRAWQQSLESYDRALALLESDADARHNRDLVRAALEQLQQQQQQQQQKEQQGDEEQQEGESGQPQEQQAGEPGQPGEEREPSPSAGSAGEKQPSESGQAGAPPEGAEQPSPAGQDERQQAARPPAEDQPKPGAGEDAAEREKHAQARPAEGERDPQPSAESPGAAQTGGADEAGERSQDAAAAVAPGQMSPSDARQLLDALRGEERRVPVLAGAAAEGAAGADATRRDW